VSELELGGSRGVLASDDASTEPGEVGLLGRNSSGVPGSELCSSSIATILFGEEFESLERQRIQYCTCDGKKCMSCVPQECFYSRGKPTPGLNGDELRFSRWTTGHDADGYGTARCYCFFQGTAALRWHSRWSLVLLADVVGDCSTDRFTAMDWLAQRRIYAFVKKSGRLDGY
jgi:hypothetical protein